MKSIKVISEFNRWTWNWILLQSNICWDFYSEFERSPCYQVIILFCIIYGLLNFLNIFSIICNIKYLTIIIKLLLIFWYKFYNNDFPVNVINFLYLKSFIIKLVCVSYLNFINENWTFFVYLTLPQSTENVRWWYYPITVETIKILFMNFLWFT